MRRSLGIASPHLDILKGHSGASCAWPFEMSRPAEPGQEIEVLRVRDPTREEPRAVVSRPERVEAYRWERRLPLSARWVFHPTSRLMTAGGSRGIAILVDPGPNVRDEIGGRRSTGGNVE